MENTQMLDLALPTNRILRGTQSSMKIDQKYSHPLRTKKAEIIQKANNDQNFHFSLWGKPFGQVFYCLKHASVEIYTEDWNSNFDVSVPGPVERRTSQSFHQTLLLNT